MFWLNLFKVTLATVAKVWTVAAHKIAGQGVYKVKDD